MESCVNIMHSDGTKTNKRLLIVSCGFIFFIGVESGALHFTLLSVTDEFSLRGAMIGVLLAIQYFALFVAQPVFGYIADRVGKKRIIYVSICMFIVGCTLMAIASVVSVLIIGMFLAGMGYGATASLICASLVDEFFDKAERYTNFTNSLFCLGAVVGPLIASWVSSFANIRYVFLFTAAGFLALLPLFASTTLKQRNNVQDKASPRFRGRAIIPFAILAVSIFFYGGIETSAAGYFNSLLTQALSTPEFGAYSISLFWLAMMVSRILFALLRLSAKWVVFCSMISCAIVFAIMSLSFSPVLSLVLCALAGASCGPIWAVLVSFAAKEYPAFSGTVVALMSASSGLGAALMPIAVGWSVDRYSLHFAMFLIGLMMVLCVLAYAVHLRRDYLKKQ